MTKVALVIMTDSDMAEGRGRMIHALYTANECKNAGDDLKIIFDGIGVKWLDAFAKRDHPFTQNYGALFDALKDEIHGACNFCSQVRFEVGDSVQDQGYSFLGEDGNHHGLRDESPKAIKS